MFQLPNTRAAYHFSLLRWHRTMGQQASTCAICHEAYGPDVLFCPKDGAPLGAKGVPDGKDPYLGLCLPGQIRIERLIGTGSMGRVYLAQQADIERSVAVKILHREMCTDTTLLARFEREAHIAGRLAHPNVVEVLMTGRLPDSGSGGGATAYMVIEYLDGISLRSALGAAGGAIPLPRALHIVLQVCDAVGEAHAQGIVHRDMKPENVMLVRRGEDRDFVKVLDFGIARMTDGDTLAPTRAGLVFGSPKYVSPEGASGKPVGPAADVYSIATMLYQALAGRSPFEGDSPVELLAKQIGEPAPPLRSIPRASYVPEPLAAAIMKNLGKDPDRRSPDARALGRALVDAARQSGLAPDDLMARSTLLGGPAGGRAHALPSIDATKRLALDPPGPAGVDPAADMNRYPDPDDDPSEALAHTHEIRATPRTVAIVVLLCFLVGAAIAVPAAHLFGGHAP
jgi:eukaryotic-like serine/threonine-protein kinase